MRGKQNFHRIQWSEMVPGPLNKANLKDLIATTGLVILLELYSNPQFFSPCEHEIWWMTLENNKAPLLYYVKICASFQINLWNQTGVTVWQSTIQVKIGKFLSRVTLKSDAWPWKTIRHHFYTMSSFVHHFKAMGEFKLEFPFGNTQFGSKSAILFWNLTIDLEKH